MDGWLAATFLDEALSVFGALQSAVHLDERYLEEGFQAQLRQAASELLDDAAYLAPLAAAAPSSASWPRAGRHVGLDEPLACLAVEALARYAKRLAVAAHVLRAHRADGAPVFAQLATAAQHRLKLLA